ncbi:MAG TPA: ABC transporter permease [Acidobacteriaceae bacterium]|jgi:predicted permease|nr:ABC transporter permease [Acidobacteriaceae bacterium]
MGFRLRFRSALRTLLRKQQSERELDAEVRSYVEALAEEKIKSGIPPIEARRQALAQSGGLEQVKQAVRDQRASTTIESIFQDIRYGLRQMRHNPAFTWTAVITLGLGIGATTAIFSAVYALLLRPLPYPGASRLVEITEEWPKDNDFGAPLVDRDFVAAQSSLKSFSSVAGYIYENEGPPANESGDQNLTGTGSPVRVKVVRITANFLPVLHVAPAQGRNFFSNEDREGGPAVALLSHRLWESRFDSDPRIIGRSLTLDDKPWTVVGVLPAHFVFPDPALEPDVYIPADLSADTALASAEITIDFVQPIGRLRNGVTLQQAQAELRLFVESRAKGYGSIFVEWAKGRQILAEPLQRYLTGDNRGPLLILLGCVGAVLLIACVNVANLQLARTVAREHEMALRGALGAGRLRLIRQLLVEGLALSTTAAILGLAIAAVVTWLIRRGGMPGDFSSGSYAANLLQAPFGKLSAAVQVNGWVLVFTAGLALLTTILFGLAPAIGASRTDLRTALQGTARRISAGRQQRRLRSVLLMAEIGLAVVLLTGAGLLIRSFVNVLRNDSGFDPRHSLTAELQRNPSEAPEKVSSFVHQLLPRLQALPGVQAAAIASGLPLENCPRPRRLRFGDGPQPSYLHQPRACSISISPEYFRAAGTSVLQGRPFSDDDSAGAVPVAIVNHAFARQYFNGDALGRQFGAIEGSNEFASLTIVGIVQDVRYDGLTGGVQPAIYLPFDQTPQRELAHSLRTILLRTSVVPGSLSSALRRAVMKVDPGQPLFDVETMDQRMSQSVARQRLTMVLTGCFAGLALILAGVGIYGVFAYWINQRRQEMGIRLALGSSRAELLRLIVVQAIRLILAGGILGLASAWFLDRLLASSLVGIRAHDPVSFSFAWILMTVTALAGSWLPAMTAARTDLVSVLRSE